MKHREFSRLLTLIGVVVVALLATACGSAGSSAQDPSAADKILAPYDLDGLDARALVEKLDALPVAERPDDLTAGVRPETLMLTNDAGAEASLPMPKDEFYVSLAPYVEKTHECYYHSLTTCLGELSATDVDVVVTDVATSQTILEETIRTHDNGFLGLWLPRDIDASITVQYDGRSSESTISTGIDDPTCITTLQLT